MPDQHRERRMAHLGSHEAHVLAGTEQQGRVRMAALIERTMAQSRAA